MEKCFCRNYKLNSRIWRNRIDRKNDRWRWKKIKLIKIKGLIALECKTEKDRV